MILLVIACPAMAADFYPETLTLISAIRKHRKQKLKKTPDLSSLIAHELWPKTRSIDLDISVPSNAFLMPSFSFCQSIPRPTGNTQRL